MHIYRSNVYQDSSNVFYQQEIEVKTVDDLREATRFDYMPFKTNGKRCLENVDYCNLIYHDYDNDHSENPEDWITLQKAQEIYKGLRAFFITSRNHEKEKDGKKARPRFHVFLPSEKTFHTKLYAQAVEYLKECFPFADRNAMDAARFFYGFSDPEIIYQDGCDILEWARARKKLEDGEKIQDDLEGGKIYTEPEGTITKNRNSALKAYAGHIKFEYLDKEQDDLYNELWAWNLRKCDPPLSEKEIRTTVLKSTWKDVVKKREIIKIEKNETGRKYPLNDIGDAMYLYDTLGKRYCWCQEKGMWLFFKDGVWIEDKCLRIRESVKKVFLRRLKEVKTIKSDEDKEAFIEHIGKLCNHNTRERVLKDAQSLMAVLADDFDSNDYLLNCKNGTLNLKTFEFYEHKPEEKHSKIGDVNYIPSEEPPKIFLDFINETFEGDQELINYVQKMFGFSMTGDNSRQEFYIFWGAGGNGKSQLITTFDKIMGSYAYGVAAKQIMESRYSNNHIYLAELRNIRSLFCSEGEEKAKLDIALVKQLTDEGQKLNVAQKYERPQQFYLKLHPFLITNPLPKITDNLDATWRRIRLIPFTHKVPEEKRILNFGNVMLNAGESGIFNWYIEGLKKYYKEGLEPPAKVKAVTDKYQLQSDEVQTFIDECCEVGNGLEVTSNALFEAWKKWSGKKYDRQNYFSPKIEEKGFEKKRIGENKVSTFIGLRLLEQPTADHKNDFMD